MPFTQQKALCSLAQFPKNRLFQLFVDGAMHAKGQGDKAFEAREPGCMRSFYRALAFALDHINEAISKELILNIHLLATENVEGDFPRATARGQFRGGPMHPFSIPKERSTKAGILSLMNRNIPNEAMGQLLGYSQYSHDLKFFNNSQKQFITNLIADDKLRYPLSYMPPFNDTHSIISSAVDIIENTNNELQKHATDHDYDGIIKAAASKSRACELLHPFGDGNGRVFTNIILNMELIQHGLLPATFFEPNVFDLYAEDELVDVIKDAIYHTLFVMQNPEAPLYGFQPSTEIDYLNTTPLIDAIERIADQTELDAYFAELNAYLLTAWNGVYNLHRYSAVGQLEKIKELISSTQVDLMLIAPENTSPLYKGLAPLHIACKMNQYETAAFISHLDRQTVNQKDSYGNTPIYYALYNNNLLLVDLLLKEGADLNHVNEKQESPLDCAAQHVTSEIFDSVLQHLPRTRLSEYTEDEILGLINHACRAGNSQLINWIALSSAIDLCKIHEKFVAKKKYNYSFIYLTIQENHYELCESLIKRIYSENKMSFEEALLYIENLVDKHANLRLVNQVLNTVIAHTSLATKKTDIDYETFCKAFMLSPKMPQIALKLIDLEPNIASIKDFDNTNLISTAAAYGLKEITIKLAEKGCDPAAESSNEWTALHYAALNNKPELIQYFCETLKINPDIVIKINKLSMQFFWQKPTVRVPETPLVLAVKSGHIESATLLIKLGAQITAEVKTALNDCKQNKDAMENIISRNTLELS